MLTVIKLTKADITTKRVGLNFMIEVNKEVNIIFDEDAVNEFVNDVKFLQSEKSIQPLPADKFATFKSDSQKSA